MKSLLTAIVISGIVFSGAPLAVVAIVAVVLTGWALWKLL